MMIARQTESRFVLATALTLLAMTGRQYVIAGAGESRGAVVASDDLNTLRQRILKPLLAPVPAETASTDLIPVL